MLLYCFHYFAFAKYSTESLQDQLLDAEELVRRLNRKLTGWANYFCLGPVSPAYQLLDTHARSRLRRWLCMKHKDASTGRSRYPDEYLHEVLGLVRLAPRTHDLPWAKA
jgi:RNA-directed DNA polymerase